MEKHFNKQIDYDGCTMEISVQVLSAELPKIILSVKPRDFELIKHLENVRQFYFHINSENIKENLLDIRNYVVYDYVDNVSRNTDIKFEFAVWKSLLFFDIKDSV